MREFNKKAFSSKYEINKTKRFMYVFENNLSLFLKKLKRKTAPKIIFGIASEKGKENNNNATAISKK
jgi:hypothetical protein